MARQRCCTNLWLLSPPKPTQMGGVSGYISGPFATGSSDFFSLGDVDFSSLIYETRSQLFSPLTNLCSRSRPTAWLTPHWFSSCFSTSLTSPAIQRTLERALKEQISRRCCKCHAVTVTRAGLPSTPLMVTASVFHAWAPPTLKLHSHRRNVLIVKILVSPLYTLG